MKCKKIKYLIPDYFSEELSTKDKQIISEHLKSCSKCNYGYVQLGKLFDQLKNEKLQEPPHQYWINLLPKIHNRIENKKSGFTGEFIKKVSIPLAAALLAIIITIRVFDFSIENIRSEYTEVGKLDEIVKQLSNEELELINETNANFKIISANGYDKFAIEEILANNEGEHLDLININTTLNTLSDSEVNRLLTLLHEN